MAAVSLDTNPTTTLKRLEAKGGRKLALQNGKVEGSDVGKNTALFLEAVAQTSRRQDALHKLGGANDSR